MTADRFNVEVEGHRFKAHTCLDVHSCSKAAKVSAVHAAFQTKT